MQYSRKFKSDISDLILMYLNAKIKGGKGEVERFSRFSALYYIYIYRVQTAWGIKNIVRNDNYIGKHGRISIDGVERELSCLCLRLSHCSRRVRAINLNPFTNAELNMHFVYGLAKGYSSVVRLYRQS